MLRNDLISHYKTLLKAAYFIRAHKMIRFSFIEKRSQLFELKNFKGKYGA